MARWVAATLAAAGAGGPIHVVAHDFGGPYGIAWAILHRDRVATIALTNTIFFPNLRWHRWARVWRTPLLGELAAALTTRAAFRAELRRGGPGLTDAHIDEAWARITPRTHRAVLALYRSTDPAVFGQRVPGGEATWHEAWLRLAAEVPSLTLWGELDPYLRASWIADLGTREVARFPDSGHWLPAEDPDGFAARLRAHLEAPGAALR
jgi:pimeloyl-ACP methyl ester carboxylesterase